MRVSRDELRFDFGEARFRLPRDRALLGWIVDQFLYGEVTGIQVGHLALRRSHPSRPPPSSPGRRARSSRTSGSSSASTRSWGRRPAPRSGGALPLHRGDGERLRRARRDRDGRGRGTGARRLPGAHRHRRRPGHRPSTPRGPPGRRSVTSPLASPRPFASSPRGPPWRTTCSGRTFSPCSPSPGWRGSSSAGWVPSTRSSAHRGLPRPRGPPHRAAAPAAGRPAGLPPGPGVGTPGGSWPALSFVTS